MQKLRKKQKNRKIIFFNEKNVVCDIFIGQKRLKGYLIYAVLYRLAISAKLFKSTREKYSFDL